MYYQFQLETGETERESDNGNNLKAYPAESDDTCSSRCVFEVDTTAEILSKAAQNEKSSHPLDNFLYMLQTFEILDWSLFI